MASIPQRFRYESRIYFHSSAEESEDPTSSGENQVINKLNENAAHINQLNPSNLHQHSPFQSKNLDVEMRRYQSRSKPKCFSKNAQMARENRLKKKIYLAKLEKEVDVLKQDKSKLSTVVESQSLLITQLNNEVKYLRGVLANSSDISKILRNIHQSTGMSVSTSLNKSLKINDCSKSRAYISKKTIYPWEDAEDNFSKTPTPEIYTNELCDDFNLDVSLSNENDLTPFLFDETNLEIGIKENDGPNSVLDSLKEHNYTSKSLQNEDVGICLHVSKHKVSLEFCSSCEENAKEVWD